MAFIRGSRFRPVLTQGDTNYRSSVNQEWYQYQSTPTVVSSTTNFPSEFGGGTLVQDTSGNPFVLLYEFDELTGNAEACALYPDGTKVCPAPTWDTLTN